MYKIVITKLEELTRTKSDYERIADTGNERDHGPVYAYVQHPEVIIEETEIYRQRVDDLSLDAVIKAVNAL